MRTFTFLTAVFLVSCSAEPETPSRAKELIAKSSHDPSNALPPLQQSPLPVYSWDPRPETSIPEITKYSFRCKGNPLNPIALQEESGKEPIELRDCGGPTTHSLPIHDGEEFIYPILIDLLNYIQDQTDRQVILTSGHRCTQHNTYCDPSRENVYSKHQIGAEVSFYVEGMEHQPEKMIPIIASFYEGADDPNLTDFERWPLEKTNIRTPPWYNKEIFIKLYQSDEGRNFDNPHPYPYIAIQVRYDLEKNERATYSWEKAHQGYYRY